MVKVDFAKYFMRHNGHGNGLIIKGGVRKGKTTLISLIATILLQQTNFVIISNVRFDTYVYAKYPTRIFYITSLREYLRYISEIPYSKPIILVWDDAQTKEGMTSKGVMSKEGKKLASFLIFIGKLQTSYIYVAHQSYIPRALIEGFEPIFLYKINQETFVLSADFYSIDSHALQDSENKIIRMPKINFVEILDAENGEIKKVISESDTKYLRILSTAFTDFKFNVDLDKLYDYLTRFEVGEKTKEAIAEFLNATSNIDSEFENLDSISLEQIYMALSIKNNRLISTGEKIGNLINPKIVNDARKKLRKMGFEFEK